MNSMGPGHAPDSSGPTARKSVTRRIGRIALVPALLAGLLAVGAAPAAAAGHATAESSRVTAIAPVSPAQQAGYRHDRQLSAPSKTVYAGKKSSGSKWSKKSSPKGLSGLVGFLLLLGFIALLFVVLLIWVVFRVKRRAAAAQQHG
ncbi:hypothetical protein FCH28_14055 [Streptomyces piniterrae]|uniref:Uncharacterized protein n=2 Tax=Streptomyces piniterrae TaxID=2571125 RepID=A0A4V6WHP6_9ACTN|nr:hypothetical protein FCH28_14055 [Streptomyces piniterrae]